MPPEDELSDEVPLRDETEGEPSPADPGDSSVDFASDADVPIAGEAPDVDPYAFQDYDGPTEDLSGELAEDAGAEASYGYDAASETERFDRAGIDPSMLAESAGTPDESGQYQLSPSDSSVDQGGFVEEVAAGGSSDEQQAYEPAAAAPDESDGGYASHHPDMDEGEDPGHVAFGGHQAADEVPADAQEEEAPVAQGFSVEEEEAPVAQGFSVEEEEAPVAQGFTVEEEEAPPPAPTRAAPPPMPTRRPAEAEKDEVRPGQVRKSAIDEMFARAAQLKREKGR
ncbi:MAG: hypothetical protein M9894_03020 [Planctomycetes bacterium]|nr:hypothetical protein [Planctomycetota bacterium]